MTPQEQRAHPVPGSGSLSPPAVKGTDLLREMMLGPILGLKQEIHQMSLETLSQPGGAQGDETIKCQVGPGQGPRTGRGH